MEAREGMCAGARLHGDGGDSGDGGEGDGMVVR